MVEQLPEDFYEPSPSPCAFETHRYGLANVLLDRDGRVLGTHLRYGNGALIAEAPAMADLLCDLLAGVPDETKFGPILRKEVFGTANTVNLFLQKELGPGAAGRGGPGPHRGAGQRVRAPVLSG